MSGHLFVLEGDARRIACDAWLLPTDRSGRVNKVWSQGAPELAGRISSLRGHPALKRGERVAELPGFERGPRILAVDTGGTGHQDASWYARGIEAGIKAALRALPRTSRHRRERHLIAMPLFGLGEGFGSPLGGEIVESQIDTIKNIGERTRRQVDFAVLASGRAKLAAAQQARVRVFGKGPSALWPELTHAERAHVERLGGLLDKANLVLFVGAGASVGAGLPGWTDLLEHLRRSAKLRRTDLDELNPLDQARMIRASLGDEFGPVMANLFAGHKEQSLVHQLLASLPVTEAATTNYDTLFEDAWRFRGREVAVLPRKRASVSEGRWLLKLHGTIQRPSSVVLTRDDYMRMDREGSALAGIVQALLITRHMLFVGYSLDDDRFHQIAHDARAAIGSRDERPETDSFGTALSPIGRPSFRKLWAGEIEILDLSARRGTAAGARRIEILLDHLVFRGGEPAAYLNHPGFGALWSKSEAELAVAMKRALDVAARTDAGPAGKSVARQLRRMLDPDESD